MKQPILQLLALTLPLFAVAEVDAPFVRHVGVLVEYFDMESSDVPGLLHEYQDEPAADGLLARVREMVKEGNARLAESSYVLTRSGHRTRIESIREMLYPTDYTPIQIYSTGEPGVHPQVINNIPQRPTHVEMRPVGNTLEVDPVVSHPPKAVELNIAPELVELRGFQPWGKDDSVTTPEFHTMKSSSAISVALGSSALIGVHLPAKSQDEGGGGKQRLCFVTPQLLYGASVEEFEAFKANPPVEKEEEDEEFDENPDPFAPAAGGNWDDPFAPGEPGRVAVQTISTITELIEVDAATASRLILEQGSTVDATAMRSQLNAQIKRGEAKMLQVDYILTRNGQQAKSESIREFIYPTEADPPSGVAGQLGSKEPKKTDARTVDPAIGVSDFEMRPTGLTVEIDPNYQGNGIDLNIAPELVRLARLQTYGSERFSCQQPIFETLRISTAVTAADGKPLLLGMHSLETARASEIATEEERNAVRDRRVLVFVTSKVKQM